MEKALSIRHMDSQTDQSPMIVRSLLITQINFNLLLRRSEGENTFLA